MNTTNVTDQIEDLIEAKSAEPLCKRLREMTERMNRRNSWMNVNAESLAKEVIKVCYRIEREQSGASDLNRIINEVKIDLGWLHAASLVMMIVYGIMSQRTDLTLRIQGLMTKMREKYKMRPELLESCKAVQDYKLPMNPNHNYIHVNHADIKILSPGNVIGNTIQYGK